MFDEIFLKALGKAEVSRYKGLENVYYSQTFKSFVATDAHVLLMYKAECPEGGVWFTPEGHPITVENDLNIDNTIEKAIETSKTLTTVKKYGKYAIIEKYLYKIKDIELVESFMNGPYEVHVGDNGIAYYRTIDEDHKGFITAVSGQWKACVGEAQFDNIEDAEAFATAIGLTVTIEVTKC